MGPIPFAENATASEMGHRMTTDRAGNLYWYEWTQEYSHCDPPKVEESWDSYIIRRTSTRDTDVFVKTVYHGNECTGECSRYKIESFVFDLLNNCMFVIVYHPNPATCELEGRLIKITGFAKVSSN